MKKKVMVFGTFDGFHEGHRRFLSDAKTHGTHLIVVVARDTTIACVYGKSPQMDDAERLASLLSEGIAEDIVMGHEYNKHRVLTEHKPDVIVLGFTQKKLVDGIHKKAQEVGLDHIEIVLSEPFEPEKYPPSNYNKTEIHVD